MEHALKVFDEKSQPNVVEEKSSLLEQNKPDFKELDLGSLRLTEKDKDLFRKRFNRSHSGELNATSIPNMNTQEKIRSGSGELNRKMGHRRSYSTGAPLIHSGNGTTYVNRSSTANTTSSGSTSTTTNSGGSGVGDGGNVSSVNSPNTNLLYPSGNICPSGKVHKPNMNSRNPTTRPEKLGLGMGTGSYGHGSIIKGGGKSVESNGENGMINVKKVMSSHDVEEVKIAGNEFFKRGNFTEALSLYDRAIAISPENAACRSNRAAVLTMLGRLGEAVWECEEAVRLNPGYQRAHQRLASLYLRLGLVERASHHLLYVRANDSAELQKLQALEKHINRCSDARKIGDWKGALRECEAALLTGAVSSPQIIACKAEAFLKLHQLEDADSVLVELPKLEPFPVSCSKVKFFGMCCEAYVLYVRAHVDMAFGRFETATAFVEKARLIDSENMEVATLQKNVTLINRARAQGKELFNSGRFSDACTAYGEGLKCNLSNSILYCNMAVCWSKLGLWDKSVEECNLALNIHPNYTKAIMRRAVSNAKLERWGKAVRDYEILRKKLPEDNEVAESLLRAQEALRLTRGEPSGVDRLNATEYSSEPQRSSIKSRNH